jgi:8-oxo-dGTP diphosphatase
MSEAGDLIRAAGGVVVRDGRVAVVHRPHHADWSLPKGKLEDSEGWEDAALREVQEECGLRCRLVRELTPTEYEVRGTPKLVRWWLMDVVEDLGFTPSSEVDELRRLVPDDALALLSYEPDRALVREAAGES